MTLSDCEARVKHYADAAPTPHSKGRRQDHPFDKLRAGLELKATSALNKAHEAQAHNYPSPSLRTGLAATGLRLAILINFGAPSLQWKRIIR